MLKTFDFRKIFFSNWLDSGTTIEKADLDGSNRELVIKGGLGILDCLYADRETLRIYWVDSGRQTLQSSTYDGMDPKVHYTFTNVDVTSVTVVRVS